jgi:hypothetical protein
MRLLLAFIVIPLFLIVTDKCFADGTQDTLQVPKDSLTNTKINEDKGFDIIVRAGGGMTTGSTWGFWEHKMVNGPVAEAGLEIPFTRSHIFALEVYGNMWICRAIGQRSFASYVTDRYREVYDNHYSNLGITADMKWYLFDNSSRVRPSISLGAYIYGRDKEESGLQLGVAINYAITSRLVTDLTYRGYLGEPDLGGNTDDGPNFLVLHISYKFNVPI